MALDLFRSCNFPLTFPWCPLMKTAQLNEVHFSVTQIKGLKQKCLRPVFKHQVLSSQNSLYRITKTCFKPDLFCCPSKQFSYVTKPKLPSFYSALVDFCSHLGYFTRMAKFCAAVAGSFPFSNAHLTRSLDFYVLKMINIISQFLSLHDHL